MWPLWWQSMESFSVNLIVHMKWAGDFMMIPFHVNKIVLYCYHNFKNHAFSPWPPFPPLFSLVVPKQQCNSNKSQKFSEWKHSHVGMEPSKTNQTRWGWHHNTFTPSLHLVPFANYAHHKTFWLKPHHTIPTKCCSCTPQFLLTGKTNHDKWIKCSEAKIQESERPAVAGSRTQDTSGLSRQRSASIFAS